MTTGLAIGKFWPPHAGHQLVIDSLWERCERVAVIVCASTGQIPSGGDRAIWLQAVYPHAEVVVVDDLCAWHHPEDCYEACSELWADRIGSLGIGPIDLVATSEAYGERWAGLIGTDHLRIDPERSRIPISSTAIRSDLGGTWKYLHPAVRMGLTRRVVVLGAESTGTSTLAADLAGALGVPFTGEAGRTVSWELYAGVGDDMEKVRWTEEIFWDVVNKQVALEHYALNSAADRLPGEVGPWVVCDTDTLATVAWWERYLGTDSGTLQRFASVRLADLYLLTDPTNVAFDESDPLRDGVAIRLGMHARLVELLEASRCPWRLMVGDRSERLSAAIEVVKAHEYSNPRWVHH